MSKSNVIGVFGHYGNKNLGDEAIIHSVIYNIRRRIINAEFVGFSLNPQDTLLRHRITSYPIRKSCLDVSGKVLTIKQGEVTSDKIEITHPEKIIREKWLSKIKIYIKNIPFVGPMAKPLYNFCSFLKDAVFELKFLFDSYRLLRNINILLFAGSNQFVDNFNGLWGFPYTLLKWSFIAKAAGAKVYYVSVGAGPISKKMSKVFPE